MTSITQVNALKHGSFLFFSLPSASPLIQRGLAQRKQHGSIHHMYRVSLTADRAGSTDEMRLKFKARDSRKGLGARVWGPGAGGQGLGARVWGPGAGPRTENRRNSLIIIGTRKRVLHCFLVESNRLLQSNWKEGGLGFLSYQTVKSNMRESCHLERRTVVSEPTV